MTKVYLVKRVVYKQDHVQEWVVNVFTNKKKAKAYNDWRNKHSESLFYIVAYEIDTNDYSELEKLPF